MLLNNYSDFALEAGCDEAGRGPLAGPVFAAAVILPSNYENKLLNDSKKLNESKRNELRIEIEKNALAFAVEMVDHLEIDKINILKASIKAMHLSLSKLNIIPEFIIVDGNRFYSYNNIPFQCVVKGDGKYMSIAAASILAKTYRDEYMKKIHHEFPMYSWNKNKGYPTAEHQKAIFQYGLSPFHRKSFHLKAQLHLIFTD